MYNTFFSNAPPSKNVLKFLKEQDMWVRDKLKHNYDDLTDYWKGVSLIIAQFDGLVKGYADTANKSLDLFAFQLLNGVGDFLDLLSAVDVDRRIDYSKLTPEEATRLVLRNGHCSAFIKLTGDMSDLFTGHSSWFTYSAMNRIFKHYYLDFQGDFIAAKKITFASYPGFLESLDDFYMMDSGLAMVQTTNSILDHSVYENGQN